MIVHLIKNNGQPFSLTEIEDISAELDALDSQAREAFANENAQAIASHPAPKMLVVSGPGTGKSFLFLDRIEDWLKKHGAQSVLVTTFVRKLLADLEAKIGSKLSADDAKRVTLSTLHRCARSTIERSKGTSSRPLKKHVRMIAGMWPPIVWSDVAEFHDDLDPTVYAKSAFEMQLFNDAFSDDGGWKRLHKTYCTLTQFYNAVLFCDAITLAREALAEKEDLNADRLFIIDEYQDLNQAEENLVRALSSKATATLMVGDDDQVLYEQLKQGRPELIRAVNGDPGVVKAMLPFARRGNFHVTRAAAAFIKGERGADAIQKVYLPVRQSHDDAEPVCIVGCASPGTAVAYVQRFLEEHDAELRARMTELDNGTATEPYLVVLTPDRAAAFLGKKGQQQLRTLLDPYKHTESSEWQDLLHVLEYYEVSKNPHDNFGVRKLLHFQGMKPDAVHPLLREALESNKDLCDLNAEQVVRVLGIAKRVRETLESALTAREKARALAQASVGIRNVDDLEQQLAARDLQAVATLLEEVEDKEAETAGRGLRRLSAAEQMTIVSSKGLSADYVIVLGCDDVNMIKLKHNAFFVALTRGRRGVHFVFSLNTGGSRSLHKWVTRLPAPHTRYLWYKKTGNQVVSLANLKSLEDQIRLVNSMKTKTKA